MTGAVLDASALIAYVRHEEGSDQVAAALSRAVVAAPNWAEALKIAQQKLGVEIETTSRRLKTTGVRVEPVTEDDAEAAARLARAKGNRDLSLADCFCLAVAQRLVYPAYTSDKAWLAATTDAEVVMIR